MPTLTEPIESIKTYNTLTSTRTTTLTTWHSVMLGIYVIAHLRRPDLESGALYHSAILNLVFIFLHIHTRRMVDARMTQNVIALGRMIKNRRRDNS